MARHSKVSPKDIDSDIIQNIVIKVPNKLKLSFVIRAIKEDKSLNGLINEVLEQFCKNNPLDKSTLEGL